MFNRAGVDLPSLGDAINIFTYTQAYLLERTVCTLVKCHGGGKSLHMSALRKINFRKKGGEKKAILKGAI